MAVNDIAVTKKTPFVAARNEWQGEAIFRARRQWERRHAKNLARTFHTFWNVRRKREHLVTECSQLLGERINGRHNAVNDRLIDFGKYRNLHNGTFRFLNRDSKNGTACVIYSHILRLDTCLPPVNLTFF